MLTGEGLRTKLVAISVVDGVGLISLDDPSRRNALSHALSDALAMGVRSLLDGGARAIVLTAAPPVFCAGGSLDDLLEPPGPLSASYAGLHALVECPVPTIAAVGGDAIGAGVSLALACDVTVVSPAARFDPRFLDVAIHPGGGRLWHLARRIGYQGVAALVICGDTLSGGEAVNAGLAWRCVPEPDLIDTAMRLARRAAARSPALIARTKLTLRRTMVVDDLAEAEKIEMEAQEWSVAQPEHLEAVRTLRARVGGSRSHQG